MPPASLYLHIPFCARRCPYCDFAVSVSKNLATRADYVAALHCEIARELRNDRALASIYFGGGTPTELSGEQLASLLRAILERAPLLENAEITLEANPENLSPAFLQSLRAAGFNRLSLGVQSLDDEVLGKLGRAHTVSQVETAIQQVRAAGFENFSLDLIYGAPLTPPLVWRNTLRRAMEWGVPHISAYSLTIEEGTHFGLLARKGQLQFGDDDAQGELMEIAARTLRSGGLERYEVSNWAKPGFESRHNQSYWRGSDYYGLGVGAHGHFGGHRFWNSRSLSSYLAAWKKGEGAREGEEFLTPFERLEERVALGLRTVEGLDLRQTSSELGLDAAQILAPGVDLFEKQGLLQREGDRVRPTECGLPLADGIALKILRLAAK